MFSTINDEVFRQKISALESHEVEIACDILVAMHPAQYFNALSKQFMSILKTNETVGAIYKEQYHEYQRLIGNESQIVKMPRFKLSDTRDDSEDSILYSSIDDDADAEPSIEDDINDIMNNEDIKIPNFLEKFI